MHVRPSLLFAVYGLRLRLFMTSESSVFVRGTCGVKQFDVEALASSCCMCVRESVAYKFAQLRRAQSVGRMGEF